MTGRQLITDAQNTWCPGCGNFSIQHTLKNILADMEQQGKSLDDVVLVTGIGCHAKMADYLNINTFYTLHGRTIPVATGIKLGNPRLTVICCTGDGDSYAEGLDHLIFAAKRNIDITVIVHNNRVYGLTTGQYTPTSPLGFQREIHTLRYRGIPVQSPRADACQRSHVHCPGIYQKDGPVKEAGCGWNSTQGFFLYRCAPDLCHVLSCC